MNMSGQTGERMDGRTDGGVKISTLLFQKKKWDFMNIKFFLNVCPNYI